ncbi:cation:proton antiporter (plasmid) [Comamonadaceae bacterium OTU4NAUVB1]|nr:cation:proton antiporter [Comamonadaceae bacterium OTU4NAUVB1]
MTFANWCLFLGLLLLIMSISDSLLKKLPFSSAAVYMILGIAAGPYGLQLLDLSMGIHDDAHLMEILTEVVVLVSLFAVGLKLPVRASQAPWRVPILLATVAMVITIGLTAAVGVALGGSLALSLLVGSLLAPTDPVLASEVQVAHGEDRDALRFGLTAEGGLNDGTAFPFVMLALGLMGYHELGPYGARWFGVDVLWAVVGGIGIGWLCGAGFTRAVIALRRHKGSAIGMESFLALGLIAVTYGLSIHASVYGFLAVFVAGLGMRGIEQEAVGAAAKADPGPDVRSPARLPATEVTNIALDFIEDLEKFAEMAAMLVIGSLLTLEMVTWQNALLAASLLFVIRPLSVFAVTWRSGWTRSQRRIGAWMGVRGVGSMYYLAFVLTHDLGLDPLAEQVTGVVLFTIAASVVLHGVSATPIMTLYRDRRRRGRRGDERVS